MGAIRTWLSITAVPMSIAVFSAVVVVGAVLGSMPLPVSGLITVPEGFPLNPVLTVPAGSAVALWSHYELDSRSQRLAHRRWRLVLVRLGWLLAVVPPVLIVAGSTAGSSQFSPEAYIADALLFGGLGMAAIIFGRADLVWLAPTVWVLVALLFGFPHGGGPDDWHWWAFPMQGEVTAPRLMLSVFAYLVAGTALVLAPWFGRARFST